MRIGHHYGGPSEAVPEVILIGLSIWNQAHHLMLLLKISFKQDMKAVLEEFNAFDHTRVPKRNGQRSLIAKECLNWANNWLLRHDKDVSHKTTKQNCPIQIWWSLCSQGTNKLDNDDISVNKQSISCSWTQMIEMFFCNDIQMNTLSLLEDQLQKWPSIKTVIRTSI